MAMTGGGGGDQGSGFSSLSEINVTPLVDVMLVLLVIFMVASSVETIRAERELERIRQENTEDEVEMPETHPAQKVPVDLPKVNSERVNLAEEQKLVLSMTAELDFYIGDTRILICADAEPAPLAGAEDTPEMARFRGCLSALEAKLIENEKLQADGELYLRADRGIDYGKVLAVMARIRKAGVTKFGLVAEPDLEG
jgi:biopolymer transport protein TolR